MDIIYLIGAGLAEVGLVFCMKRASGFKQLFWTVGTLFFATVSLTGLSFAMKTLDAGVAYSIWVSFGSIGALVVGSLVYGEKLNNKQMICVALIIVAVIGLKIF